MPSKKTYTLTDSDKAALRRAVHVAKAEVSDSQLQAASEVISALAETRRDQDLETLFSDLYAHFERHVARPLQRKITKCLETQNLESLAVMAEKCLVAQSNASFPKTSSIGKIALSLCESAGWSPSKIGHMLSASDLIRERRCEEFPDFEQHVNLWLALLAWNAVRKGWVLCFAQDNDNVAWIEPNTFPEMSWPKPDLLPPDIDEFKLTSWDERTRRALNAEQLWFVPVCDLVDWLAKEKSKFGPRSVADFKREEDAASCISHLAISDPTRRLRRGHAVAALMTMQFSKDAADRIWAAGAPDKWKKQGRIRKDQAEFRAEDLLDLLHAQLN